MTARRLRPLHILATVWVALWLAVAGALTCGLGPALAQTQDTAAPDYAAWKSLADRVENELASPGISDAALQTIRTEVAALRESFLAAQSTNATRIATVRAQIDALGPPPADGAVEADDIAKLRADLAARLAALQAPGIAADEAYRRADGIIREVDRLQRERQADKLLKLSPSPLNPANWPSAFAALSEGGQRVATEVRTNWADPTARQTLRDNLPLIAVYLVVATFLIWRGRPMIETLSHRLKDSNSARGRDVWALFVSLGQIVIPLIGVTLVTRAALSSGMVGPTAMPVVIMLPTVGLMFFASVWLGGRMFPKRDDSDVPLNLLSERRAEGRFHVQTLGALIAIQGLGTSFLAQLPLDDAAIAVLSFPIIAVTGLVLLRLGQLLRRHVRNDTPPGDQPTYRNRLIGALGQAAQIIGVGGPALAAIGYVAAAEAVVYPAVLSLGLLALLTILQFLVADLYALVTGNDEGAKNSLVPVLVGFALIVLSVPLFALIWGARIADLTEIWTRAREGFSIGATRISPGSFLIFAVVFAVGFTATRMVQGALRSSILPKTRLDKGGRNAIVAGVGYLGIFLAGLIAINSAGIDLSGLAIVAGALSVGIGFGLQNIVSNFVSGIILLIERPVSEGDWIEVGGVQGTVTAISVRSTRIQTFDRTDVIVPNADLVSGMVTNWTRFNLTGRLIVPVGVAYGTDTRKVERILQEIAEAQPLAVLNPPPTVVFQGFGADSLNFEIRVILRDVNFSLSVRSEINHAIAARFAKEGIEIPFAQRDVWLRNPEALVFGPRLPAATPAPGPAPGPLARDEVDLDARGDNDSDDGPADGPDHGDGRA